jgi:hypothetical protein
LSIRSSRQGGLDGARPARARQERSRHRSLRSIGSCRSKRSVALNLSCDGPRRPSLPRR